MTNVEGTPLPHRYAFVAGLHRSGTTLVARCLSEHPDVSGFHDTGVTEDEGQFLQSVYPVGRVHGGPGRFAFDPEAHLTEASPLVTPANAATLRAEWGRHWDLSRTVLLEKSPPNLVRTRFLQAMFPASSFVIVIRHPVAVAFAIKTRRPKRTDVDDMLRHWVVAHEVLEADLPHLERVTVVAYESFVAAPEPELAAVQAFLGIPPAPSGLEIRTDTNDRYFDMWRQELGRTLAGRKHRALVAELEERVRRFGYSLDDLGASGERPALAAARRGS
jgi:hypothetical protein